MAVTVELDLRVDMEFYWLGRWPNAVMLAIAEKEDEIYRSLAPNPLEQDMLGAVRTFHVEGRDYRVTFGIEKWRAYQNVFRVMRVERLPLTGKR